METSKKKSKKPKKKLSEREMDEKRKKCRERVRKYREKMTEEKKIEKRAKDREYKQKMREAGVIKSINQLSNRQQRIKRRQWKKDSNNYRRRQNLKKEEIVKESILGRKGSPRVQIGRKVAKKTYNRMRSEIQSMKTKMNIKDRKIEALRKKVNRLQNKQSTDFSPRKKVKKLIGRKRVSPAIRKNLLLNYALMSGLSDMKKKTCQNEKEKRMFNHFISLKIIKKYRMIGQLKNIISHREFRKSSQMKTMYFRRSYKEQKKIELQQSVCKFLEEDINSTMAPGVKDYITRNKVKHQKRYLRNTMQNLHKKFLESSSTKISYPTFCRLKPFWIRKPNITSRDTCLCTKHANFQFLISKLNYLELLKERQAEELCSRVCCDEKNKDCMERNCNRCKDRTLPISLIGISEEQKTFYYRWVSNKEKIKDKNGKEKIIRIITKDKIICTVGELINKANAEIRLFLKHVYIMRHQFNAIKKVKSSLNANEVVVLIDFSQNYTCKFGSEIQSLHFGASKPQVTLHTGVLYHKEQFVSFCSLSPSQRHDPSAIWAHLQPVIKLIKEDLPTVDTIHFQSDGPTSQYRNKSNFYLLAYFGSAFGFKEITWNFSEAGHGKGAADGIGGTIKNVADRIVACGTDIPNYNALLKLLREKNDLKVKIFEIAEEDIKKVDSLLTINLEPVPNTMQLHQVTWNHKKSKELSLRLLSCFNCMSDVICKHFAANPATFTFPEENNLEVKNNSQNIAVGDWVAVIYDNLWYPGSVEEINKDGFVLSFMHCTGDKYYWPEPEEKFTVPEEEIMCHIAEAPQPISRRHFMIPNKKKYDNILFKILNS